MKNNNDDNGSDGFVTLFFGWTVVRGINLVNLICHGVAPLEGSHAAASYNNL